MSYADLLREMFPELNPEVDDLFLLEAHQIAGLPERAPARELAAVLHAHPRLRRFLINRHPPIDGFLATLLAEHGPAGPDDLEVCEQALSWELADLIAYQRAPEIYDAESKVDWDIASVGEVVALDGKVVIDAGAGTGRVTFDAAPSARTVFAVEPVANLRSFMREKATRLGFGNVFVLDGFLHAIPLPAASADVLLTCQAIGWDLPHELQEIDRVVKRGGIAMHLFGVPEAAQTDSSLHGPLVAHGYRRDTYEQPPVHIVRYWKEIGG